MKSVLDATIRETGADPGTRDRVARSILEQGPSTAAELAARLGLTPAGVRRHLDALAAAGRVVGREQHALGPRRRGRPAREFALTDAGRAAVSADLATAYDDLAASALRFLAAEAGEAAVERFARQRVAELESRYLPLVEAAGADVPARVDALAGALSRDGYAATTVHAGAGRGTGVGIGTQLCQGHCPVQHVAAQFPQLCDAETEVFARLLGSRVQRLATLAHGEHVCTTHVPDPARVPPTPRTSREQRTSA